MKRPALCVIALLAIAAPARPQQLATLQQYQLDAGHSIFEFSIGFAFSRIKGRFTDAKGSILYDPANPANSSVTIIAPTKSLDTGWGHRDQHLRTADFFDVEKYPTIRFQSTRLRRNGTDWLMDGELTMHGVTKAMTVPLVLPAPRRSPESGWMILIGSTTFRIARKDFGITGGGKYNSWFNDARMATMADTVDVNIEVEGWWADAATQRVPSIVAGIERVKTQGVQVQVDRYKAQIAGKPDSVLMDYLTGPDYLVRELLEEDRAKAVELASALPAMYKGARAYAIYGHALAVAGDTAGASRQYAEAKRVFRRRPVDPKEEFPQDDDDWYFIDNLARASFERGHASAVVGLARLNSELFPDYARGLATYGWALALTGDRKGAADAFAKALRVDPNDTRALEFSRRP
jgi:polyisoprenoid-binding protein YceI